MERYYFMQQPLIELTTLLAPPTTLQFVAIYFALHGALGSEDLHKQISRSIQKPVNWNQLSLPAIARKFKEVLIAVTPSVISFIEFRDARQFLILECNIMRLAAGMNPLDAGLSLGKAGLAVWEQMLYPNIGVTPIVYMSIVALCFQVDIVIRGHDHLPVTICQPSLLRGNPSTPAQHTIHIQAVQQADGLTFYRPYLPTMSLAHQRLFPLASRPLELRASIMPDKAADVPSVPQHVRSFLPLIKTSDLTISHMQTGIIPV